MALRKDQYRFKHRDFILSEYIRKAPKSNRIESHKKLSLFRFCISFFIRLFRKSKWKISSTIFFGRGQSFKAIINLSILIILLFAGFTYTKATSLVTNADAVFVSKYDKETPDSDTTIYTLSKDTRAFELPKTFDIIKYKVNQGDNVATVADKFKNTQVSIDSIKWANNLTSDYLTPGTILDIPPISGTLHKVGKNETAEDILKKYKKITDKSSPEEKFAATQELTDINLLDIKVEGDKKVPVLVEGQKIIIPGNVSVPTTYSPPLAIKPINVKPVIASSTANTNFIWPVAGGAGTFIRGLSYYHTGVDIADFNSPFEVASADGVIISTQWELGGGGCVVRIKYDNGYMGLYAHTTCNYLVVPGQHVAQGQILVQMGTTGNSTGIHLHYELYSPSGVLLNPLAYFSR